MQHGMRIKIEGTNPHDSEEASTLLSFVLDGTIGSGAILENGISRRLGLPELAATAIPQDCYKRLSDS
jgi:hypothetical protein